MRAAGILTGLCRTGAGLETITRGLVASGEQVAGERPPGWLESSCIAVCDSQKLYQQSQRSISSALADSSPASYAGSSSTAQRFIHDQQGLASSSSLCSRALQHIYSPASAAYDCGAKQKSRRYSSYIPPLTWSWHAQTAIGHLPSQGRHIRRLTSERFGERVSEANSLLQVGARHASVVAQALLGLVH